MKRKAYPYSRFSTKEQKKGSSKARQDALVAAWLREHPEFEPDNTLGLHDEGLSGYTGANRKKGALGRFLKAIDDGLIPCGSALLVENWDRFTRECPYDAEPTLRHIFSAGITIVNLEEDEEFDEDIVRNDYKKFRSILDDIDRAHRQGKRLGMLIAGAMADKRQAEQNGIRTRRRPQPWLYWDADATYEVDGEKRKGDYRVHEHVADAVRQVFALKALGKGSVEVAQTLNADPSVWRPERKGLWYREYVDILVRNRAVLGWRQQRKGGEPIGKVSS